MIELNNIYNTECLEGMKLIPDNSVDCIITDPPFGTTRNQWDSCVDLSLLWEQYLRITKPNSAIVMFAQTPFDKVLGASNINMLKYEWVWQKENGTGFLNAKKAPLKDHENILVFYKKPPTYNPQMKQGTPYKCRQGSAGSNYGQVQDEYVTVNTGERYPTTVLQFNRDHDTFHPTQKPVDLIRYLVRTYTNENDVVLDSFMGSATTAIACIKEHRQFIGFELNKEYYDEACERIDKELSQPALF